MKTRLKLLLSIFLVFGCYNPEEDLTSLRDPEIEFTESQNVFMADGESVYPLVIRLPGTKFGNAKNVTLDTSWGTWENDSTATNFFIAYDDEIDAYVDTVRLKASRTVSRFTINIAEGSEPLKTLNLEVLPQFPEYVQIVADSIALRLTPGNTTRLKALFFNDTGFPSDQTKFLFLSEGEVNIFPREVFIESSESSATLQISTETKLDTIKLYGEIPDLGASQPMIDTLKIAIIN